MNQPIYEIPVTPPGTPAASWSLNEPEPESGLAEAMAAAAAGRARSTTRRTAGRRPRGSPGGTGVIDLDLDASTLRLPTVPSVTTTLRSRSLSSRASPRPTCITFAERPRRSRAGDTDAPDPDLMGALAEVLDLERFGPAHHGRRAAEHPRRRRTSAHRRLHQVDARQGAVGALQHPDRSAAGGVRA